MKGAPRTTTTSRSKAAPRTGPYRNSASHESIVAATWELLEQYGYHDLTIERVASRAGVGKATIYRWWQSKGALVAEAISTHLHHTPTLASGDVRADLRAQIQISIDNYSGTVAGVAIPALLADLSFDEGSYEAFRQSFLVPRREAATIVVRRAIEEGLLAPDTDIGLLLDMWAGTIFYRVLISREPIGGHLAEALTTFILGPPRTARRATATSRKGTPPRSEGRARSTSAAGKSGAAARSRVGSRTGNG